MRPLPILLLAALPLLAGCSLPEDAQGPEPAPPTASGGTAGACRDVAEASGNAPLLATLQEDPERMAARLADAMGTTIEGPPDPREDGSLVWPAGNATVTVVRGEDEARVAWEGPHEAAASREGAEALLRRALDAFGPRDPTAFEPVDTNPGGAPHLLALQTHGGRALRDAGVSVQGGPVATVSVFSLREIRENVTPMEEARAVELARDAARCALDQEGLTEAAGHEILGTDPASLGARGASLAWIVGVRVTEPEGASHCGHVLEVSVDAVSGKTLGIERPPCD